MEGYKVLAVHFRIYACDNFMIELMERLSLFCGSDTENASSCIYIGNRSAGMKASATLNLIGKT